MKRKFSNNKRGFTLLEVVVASAVSAILIMSILSIVLPIINGVRFNNNLSDAKNMSSQMIFNIQQELKYATTSEIKNGTYTSGSANENVIYQADGTEDANIKIAKLQRKGSSALSTPYTIEWFTESMYGNFTYKLYFLPVYIDPADEDTKQNDVVEVNIEVYKKGTAVKIYETKAVVKMLNGKEVIYTPVPGDPVNYLVFTK